MKIVKYIFVIIILFLFYIAFTETNYYKLKRAYNQIKTDLNIILLKKPILLTFKNYGWAEEGGDITLLKLDKKDCHSLSNFMTQNSYLDPICAELFKENNIYPKLTKTWMKENKHRDFKEYILDINRCVLCIRYHFE